MKRCGGRGFSAPHLFEWLTGGCLGDELGAGAQLTPEDVADDFRLFDNFDLRRIARFAAALGAFNHFQLGAGSDLVVSVEEATRFGSEEQILLHFVAGSEAEAGQSGLDDGQHFEDGTGLDDIFLEHWHREFSFSVCSADFGTQDRQMSAELVYRVDAFEILDLVGAQGFERFAFGSAFFHL